MSTLLVNAERCTRCGRCSIVCPMGIITPASKDSLPLVKDEAAGRCIRCGHCEAFCPEKALTLNIRPDEKTPLPTRAGTLYPDDLALYLKKRRSIRQFTKDPVPHETILSLLDVARYAASGGNGQPVQWLVIHDPEQVLKISELVVEWMQQLKSDHPMSNYLPALIAGWQAGVDVICRGAPHLLIAHIPEGNPIAPTDAIIALTHVDVAAPAWGVGTCWAGFVAAAATAGYEPLLQELNLPAERKVAYAMMLGQPKYKVSGIPRRNPLSVAWQ
jgi:nitroreductase/NAD-dependent dihydropyrimidine dehydrogenase PreA subunit